MCWEAAAIVGSAAIGAYSSNKAASAQQSAAAGAAGLSEAQYQQSREDLAPWRALGGQATRELGSLYGFGQDNAMAGPVIDEQGNPVVTNPVEGNRLAMFGQGGDTEVAHLTPGETVVPRQVADRLPGGRNALMEAFRSDGADPGKYTVGGNDDSINPRTGMREYLYGADTNEGGNTGFDGGSTGNRDGGGGWDDTDYDVTDINDMGDYGGYGGQDFDPKRGILGNVAKGVQHLFSPNPDGTWGYTDPAGFSGFQGGDSDPRTGGYGGAGGPGGAGGVGGAGSGGVGGGGGPGNALAGYGSQEDAIARFYESPDYKINFDEGARALEASAAARGGLFSGNTGTALTRYGQDYGNRLYSQYANRLQAFAGLGQTAATNTGQFGASAAGQQGNAMMAGGNAAAAGWEGLANSINAGVGNAMYSNYMNQ